MKKALATVARQQYHITIVWEFSKGEAIAYENIVFLILLICQKDLTQFLSQPLIICFHGNSAGR